jgi:hypothetical protein
MCHYWIFVSHAIRAESMRNLRRSVSFRGRCCEISLFIVALVPVAFSADQAPKEKTPAAMQAYMEARAYFDAVRLERQLQMKRATSPSKNGY